MVLPNAPILLPVPPSRDQQARERIRTWVAATGVTQTDLAERIGRNQAWMSRYLKGEFDADLRTLEQMAEAFGFTLTALLDLPTDPFEGRVLEEVRALPPKARTILLDLLTTLRLSHQRRALRPTRK
jgi:transcriptional regulator with XRE-family HTH domain